MSCPRIASRWERVFDRVFDHFIENTHHKLLRGAWEKLVAQVDVIGNSAFQVGIAAFLVFLLYNAVGNDFEEARAG